MSLKTNITSNTNDILEKQISYTYLGRIHNIKGWIRNTKIDMLNAKNTQLGMQVHNKTQSSDWNYYEWEIKSCMNKHNNAQLYIINMMHLKKIKCTDEKSYNNLWMNEIRNVRSKQMNTYRIKYKQWYNWKREL